MQVRRRGWRFCAARQLFGQKFQSCGKAAQMFKSQIAAAALIAVTIAGCNQAAPPISEARPTVTVHEGAEGEIVSLTGQVRAKDQVSLAFPSRAYLKYFREVFQ
jgi:hypothetical protein